MTVIADIKIVYREHLANIKWGSNEKLIEANHILNTENCVDKCSMELVMQLTRDCKMHMKALR